MNYHNFYNEKTTVCFKLISHDGQLTDTVWMELGKYLSIANVKDALVSELSNNHGYAIDFLYDKLVLYESNDTSSSLCKALTLSELNPNGEDITLIAQAPYGCEFYKKMEDNKNNENIHDGLLCLNFKIFMPEGNTENFSMIFEKTESVDQVKRQLKEELKDQKVIGDIKKIYYHSKPIEDYIEDYNEKIIGKIPGLKYNDTFHITLEEKINTNTNENQENKLAQINSRSSSIAILLNILMCLTILPLIARICYCVYYRKKPLLIPIRNNLGSIPNNDSLDALENYTYIKKEEKKSEGSKTQDIKITLALKYNMPQKHFTHSYRLDESAETLMKDIICLDSKLLSKDNLVLQNKENNSLNLDPKKNLRQNGLKNNDTIFITYK